MSRWNASSTFASQFRDRISRCGPATPHRPRNGSGSCFPTTIKKLSPFAKNPKQNQRRSVLRASNKTPFLLKAESVKPVWAYARKFILRSRSWKRGSERRSAFAGRYDVHRVPRRGVCRGWVSGRSAKNFGATDQAVEAAICNVLSCGPNLYGPWQER